MLLPPFHRPQPLAPSVRGPGRSPAPPACSLPQPPYSRLHTAASIQQTARRSADRLPLPPLQVEFLWETQGRAVLVKSQTAVDKGSKGKFSGSSFYYGSSSLYCTSATARPLACATAWPCLCLSLQRPRPLRRTDSDCSRRPDGSCVAIADLTSDGSFECAVPLDKDGPVQDVAWVPGNMQVTSPFALQGRGTRTN